MLNRINLNFGPKDTECYAYEFEDKSPQSWGEGCTGNSNEDTFDQDQNLCFFKKFVTQEKLACVSCIN